jgi:hypothetical protein
MSVQQAAINAIAAQTTLTDRVRDLEKEIIEMKTWETEKQRYELKVVARGATTYALKESAEETEPPHWICTACYQNGKKSILQAGPTARQGPDFRLTVWHCHACRAEMRTPFTTSPTVASHPTEM